jgi:hypothetical protein
MRKSRPPILADGFYAMSFQDEHAAHHDAQATSHLNLCRFGPRLRHSLDDLKPALTSPRSHFCCATGERRFRDQEV